MSREEFERHLRGTFDAAMADMAYDRTDDAIFAAKRRFIELEDRIAILEKMLNAKSAFIDELAIAAGYFPGEAITATALIARLKHGD